MTKPKKAKTSQNKPKQAQILPRFAPQDDKAEPGPQCVQEVLRLVAEGRPPIKVAEDLGIRPNLIAAWRKREKKEVGAVAFAQAGGKVLTPEEENKALRDELAVTRRERDILKKALAIFSKEPQCR